MSSLFLFGAGASFGSGPCSPSVPPLGGQLFPALQTAGGAATRVSDELAQLFASDFEAGMDRFWEEHNTRTTELLRDMARYFVQFEPLEGNLYIELIKILGGTRKKALMATTNYDLLIEHAIVKSGLLVKYGGLPAPGRYIPVLKIHGSCNFLPDIQPRQISGIGFDLANTPGVGALSANVRIAQSAKEVIEFCDREDSIAPAVAMYHPTKRVIYCQAFVETQQQAFDAALKQVARVYVIGLRIHTVDEHIWKPLAASKAKLYYVGREPEDFESWVRNNERRAAYSLANSFEDGIRHIAAHHGYRTR